MKTSALRAFFLTGILCHAGTGTGRSASPHWVWDLAQPLTTAVGTALPEKTQGNHLILPPGPAVSLVDDGEAPGGRALVFDGRQNAAATSQTRVRLGPDLRCVLSFKPAPDPGVADAQSVLYVFQACEMRYRADRGMLHFIVWHDGGKKWVEVSLPAKAGEWNSAEAIVLGSQIELRLNGASATAPFPAGAARTVPEAPIAFGFASGRPYSGLIAAPEIGAASFR